MLVCTYYVAEYTSEKRPALKYRQKCHREIFTEKWCPNHLRSSHSGQIVWLPRVRATLSYPVNRAVIVVQLPLNEPAPSQRIEQCKLVTQQSLGEVYLQTQHSHFNEEPISSKIPGQAEIKTGAKNAHRCTGLSTAHEVRRCPNINGASMPIIYGMEGSQFHRIWALLFIQDE